MVDELKFVQVGELALGITENRLPANHDLSGRSIRLFFTDGAVIRYDFATIDVLTWETIQGKGKGDCGNAVFRATCPRKEIYLVDYVARAPQATTVSHIIDFNTQSATTVIATLPTAAQVQKDLFTRANERVELTSVTARFLSAAIDRPFNRQLHAHAPTADLVGKRVRYVYSATEAYEHIYLNEQLYTWHCLAGVEKGLADTDRCHYHKIGDGLYLFVWREKIVPTLGVVLIDLDRMKTTGKLFGYESGDFGKLTNAPIGAHATLLNITTSFVPGNRIGSGLP